MKNIFLYTIIFSIQFFSTNLLSQTKQFEGEWIKYNTTYVFEFDLLLKHKESDLVEGYFIWKVVRYDEGSLMSKKHYENKLGTTGKEFLKGNYNPNTQEYTLKGFKKEDPNNIIGLDTYRLKVDENGDIGGTTRTSGSWQGRINGKEILVDVL